MYMMPGFGGERCDPLSGTYHFGNGYRAYSPVLMSFACPDSASPFGAGGLNPYAYCAGDPVNRADPSGHLSWQAWMGIGIGAVGLGLAVLTAGESIAAAGGILAAVESASAVSLAAGTAGIVGDVTAIASGAAENRDPKASAVLGWLSLTTSICGFAGGMRAVSRVIARRWGLSQASHVTLGGQMDLVATGPGIYMFQDSYKQARRLNIVAHSRFVDGELRIGGMNGSARQISQLLRKYYSADLKDVNYLRLVTCNGADGGPRSFAAKLAIETSTPVKAYEGQVSIVDRLDPQYVHRTMNGDIAEVRWPGVDLEVRYDLYNASAGPFDMEKKMPGYSPRYFLPRLHPTFERLLGDRAGQRRRRNLL